MSRPTTGLRFPRTLRHAWRLSDPASGTMRLCDALGADTYQQRLSTSRGDYWICSETGQLARAEHIETPTTLCDAFWQQRIDRRPSDEEKRREHARQLAKVRQFESYRQTGRLFEVGSGLGRLLHAAHELGWRADGNELSPLAGRFAESSSGVRVISGPMENVQLERAEYDVILMDNVFEHLLAPRAVLHAVAAALRPGGAIYLHTLCAQSLSLWWNPCDSYCFNRPHYFVPTKISMAYYFAGAGLEVVSQRTRGFTFGSVDGFADGRKPRHRSPLERPCAYLAARVGLGHRIEFVVRRIASPASAAQTNGAQFAQRRAA
jgi:2-polyprenyl-3-methyl-5-hydroxy-6-metoxy-1,4-benzoquinol methylase